MARTSPPSSSPASRHGGAGASWLSSVINLLNTIVGAGVLAMPHALSNMGIALGVAVILWSGLTAGFGLYLQTRCARYLARGKSSFFALSQMTYPNAAVLFDAAIAVKCFGVGVSYLIIIGDLMPGVVRGFGEAPAGAEYLVDRRFWVTAFMLIVIPLSFLRRLDSLKYTSVIALVSIAYLVVLVVYHYSEGDTLPDRGPVHWFRWQGVVPTLASFPVIVFAYTCHQNMFSILNELSHPIPVRTTSVVTASIGTAAAIYVLVAMTGYLSFGSSVLGNIIAQYHPSVASTIGRAAIVVLVMFSYPLQAHPCRASLDAVARWRPRRSSFNPPGGAAEMGDLRFAILTTGILISSYLVAMAVSSLDRVLAYVGSTGSTSISFILPGLFYYKISAPGGNGPVVGRGWGKDGDEDEEAVEEGEEVGAASSSPLLEGRGSRQRWRKRRGRELLLRRLSLALAVYGVVVMVVCLIMNTFFLVAH